MPETEINEVTVKQLTDDELYHKLQELGGPVGPIVQTTRSIYERKLLQKLYGPAGSDTSECSDVPEEPETISLPETKVISPPKFQFQNKNSSSEFRFRQTSDFSIKKEGIYFDRTNLARSSIRSDLKNLDKKYGSYGEIKTPISYKHEVVKKSNLKIIFIIVFVLIIFILIVIYNMEGSGPNTTPKLKAGI